GCGRVWEKAEQIVFSRTLTRAPTRTARVEREFDPEATRKLKRESAQDIFIGGAELGALALESDLVDECHLFLHPVIVGGGKPAFRTAIRQNLELLDTRRFGTGAIHSRYGFRGVIRMACLPGRLSPRWYGLLPVLMRQDAASADGHQRNQEETEMDATTAAVDVAKTVFEVAIANRQWHIIAR